MDRCLAVDEKGRVIDGDLILYIYGTHMQRRGKLEGTRVVTTVMSNIGLYKALEAVGIGFEVTDVGDKYVWENMRQTGNRVGGEQSGHIIFSKYATTGDGVLTAIKLMQAMLDTKQPLSKLAEPVKIYPQVLRNVRVKDKETALGDPDVREAGERAERILGNDGRVLLRKSGTEPVIRIMTEAPTEDECNKAIDIITAVIKEKGYETEG